MIFAQKMKLGEYPEGFFFVKGLHGGRELAHWCSKCRIHSAFGFVPKPGQLIEVFCCGKHIEVKFGRLELLTLPAMNVEQKWSGRDGEFHLPNGVQILSTSAFNRDSEEGFVYELSEDL